MAKSPLSTGFWRRAFIMYSVSVDINLKGLDNFSNKVEQQLSSAQSGVIADCLKLWAVRFRSFLQLRFDLFSRGGGTWRPLAASTLKQRRQGKSKRRSNTIAAILRDTGTLFTALTPTFQGAPGALEERIPFGIKVGYGGTQRYVDGNNKVRRATIADIASFHQNGNLPRLPKREIIVPPDAALISTMSDDMNKALLDVATT